jgi:hypothetical protein
MKDVKGFTKISAVLMLILLAAAANAQVAVGTVVPPEITLSCNVWRIVRAGTATDLSLSFLFRDPEIVTGASPIHIGNGGQLSAAVVGGQLNTSQMTRKSLASLGKVVNVLSGCGVTMSGKSMSVRAIKLSKSEKGVLKSIGFSMSVVPVRVKGKRLVLRYEVNQTEQTSELNCKNETALEIGQTVVLAGFLNSNDKIGSISRNADEIFIITIATDEDEYLTMKKDIETTISNLKQASGN